MKSETLHALLCPGPPTITDALAQPITTEARHLIALRAAVNRYACRHGWTDLGADEAAVLEALDAVGDALNEQGIEPS